jgi:predicted dehydrogenase
MIRICVVFLDRSLIAEALAKHQMFDLGAVLDPAPEARLRAVRRWGIERVFESVEAAVKNYDPEIVIITSPPGERLNILNRLRVLKGFFLRSL